MPLTHIAMSNPAEETFNSFLASTVDLSPEILEKVQAICNALETHLRDLDRENFGFPQLADPTLEIGILDRNIAIQPLRQVEVGLLLKASGTEVTQSPLDSQTCWLKLSAPNAPLAAYLDDYGYVNSRAVLKSLGTYLSDRSFLWETEKAIDLKADDCDWIFQLAPTIAVNNRNGQRIYSLIPNGQGNWRRVISQSAELQKTDARHQGKFLPVLRLLKYWNSLCDRGALEERELEALVLKVFQEREPISSYSQAVRDFFVSHLELGEDVAEIAQTACHLEAQEQFEDAIKAWQQVLGETFGSQSSASRVG